jgi:hypothetical protein
MAGNPRWAMKKSLKICWRSIWRERKREEYNHEVAMQSIAKNVTDYLDEVPVERKAALTKLRSLCLTLLTLVSAKKWEANAPEDASGKCEP